MQVIHGFEFQIGSREEKLPYHNPSFPYIASQAELSTYRETFVPWHWHNAIELFYMKSGELTYETPHETMIFKAGSAGMVNANVLHKTEWKNSTDNVQLLHIFEPQFIAGNHGSVIEEKYISPIIENASIELIPLFPDNPEQKEIIELIQYAFLLSEGEFGYEVKMREALSNVWLKLFQICLPLMHTRTNHANVQSKQLKDMMGYIHANYFDRIAVSQLASISFISERECYRLFQNHLHMTPIEYINSYRIQVACQLLIDTKMSITEIGIACGIENTSYFSKLFHGFMNATPSEYRKK